jgi:hypothetical protein
MRYIRLGEEKNNSINVSIGVGSTGQCWLAVLEERPSPPPWGSVLGGRGVWQGDSTGLG